jgi:hypothetical protein
MTARPISFQQSEEWRGPGIAQYEIELRVKECDYHGYEHEMILDHIIPALVKHLLTEFMKN